MCRRSLNVSCRCEVLTRAYSGSTPSWRSRAARRSAALVGGVGPLAFRLCEFCLLLGVLYRGVRAPLLGLRLLDPFGKRQKECTVRPEDPEIVGALSWFESNIQSWTDESGHPRDFVQVSTGTLPSLERPVVRVVN